MRGPDEEDDEAALGEALDALLRFGAMALRSGATAFRVREWMGAIARGMGIDSLAVHISLGAMTASLRRGRTSATLASEVAPIGINAWRIGALEKLAVAAEAGILPVGLSARLDAIEAVPAIHSLLTTALGVAAASGAFSYINGGGPVEVVGSMVAGGIGQTLRSLMLRRHLNQYAVTAICAVLATSIFCVILELIQAVGFPTPGHAAGFISSALFLVPGFPAGRRLARHAAAPDQRQPVAAGLWGGCPDGGRLRPLPRRRGRRADGRAAAALGDQRGHDPAAARHRQLRRRLRLRHPLQQQLAHGAGRGVPGDRRQ